MKKMLAQINIELEANGLNSNMGSLFHGYLMENIDSAYADYFHYNTTNPFTSCIFKDVKTDKFFWRVTTYNQKAYDMLMTYFSNIPESVYLKNKDLEINVKSFSIQKKSYEDLFLECTERKRIRLITPTSFKSNGITHIFPNISTLISGVITKINQHSETVELGDKKIIDELLEKVYIKDYNLRTKVFYLESIKIKGFVGTMDLAIKGEETTLANILNFLILMSEYTGLGIKEKEERDEKQYNIYERAIKENLKGYNPEIIKIKTGIKDAHHFDAYFEVIYNVFEEIKKENEGAEIYVNITSGTAQMISNLISYYIDATDINIIPIQVETYTGQSNASSEDNKTVDKYYKVKERAKENLDNNPATRTKRIIKPDLKKYSRVLIKNQIKKLVEQYEYID